MSPWLLLLLTALGGGAAVLRHWLTLRFLWRVYERGGVADMLDASRAAHLRDRAALTRARALLRRRAGGGAHRAGEH